MKRECSSCVFVKSLQIISDRWSGRYLVEQFDRTLTLQVVQSQNRRWISNSTMSRLRRIILQSCSSIFITYILWTVKKAITFFTRSVSLVISFLCVPVTWGAHESLFQVHQTCKTQNHCATILCRALRPALPLKHYKRVSSRVSIKKQSTVVASTENNEQNMN